MREIKFRAFVLGEGRKRMIKWENINAIEWCNDKLWYGDGKYVLLGNIELMQYSGLNDKNGKEIYEGDIIEHERHSRPYSSKAKIKKVKCIVTWVDGKPSSSSEELNPEMKTNKSLFQSTPEFNAYPINKELPESNWGYNWSVFHDCEIIGNIYENKSLLTTP